MNRLGALCSIGSLAASVLSTSTAAQGPRFADLQRNPLPAMATRDVALADFDRDGDLDALVVNSDIGPSTALLFNDGHGIFQDVSAANLPPGPIYFGAVAAGDVDGDGDIDLVMVRDWASGLLLNDGRGVFSDAGSRVPPPGGEARAVELGDVDGDGDLDLWIGNGHNAVGVRLFTNDGSGRFTDASGNLPALVAGITNYAIALGDLDGDRDLDALVAEEFMPVSILQLVNDGSGNFSDGTASRMPARRIALVRDLQLADIDRDGDSDLLIAAGRVHLYRNGGGGRFTDDTTSSIPAVPMNAYRIALGDFDADLDPDLWVASNQQDLLLTNDGAGRFTDVTATALPPLTSLTAGVGVGDLDGDGDPDVFAGHLSASPVVYSNLLRHLAWRDPPRIGQQLTMDVWGPAGGGYVLGAAFNEVSIRLPPYGTLFLDPGWITSMRVAALDVRGLASPTFPVPPNPALVGWSLYWQALTVMPPRLGNLEVTTFSQ